jgi:hypothetical protein
MNSQPDKQPARSSWSNAIDALEVHVQALLGNQVHHFQLVAQGGGLILRGSAHTYYAKQLAQQIVTAETDLPILANEIVVLGRSHRSFS